MLFIAACASNTWAIGLFCFKFLVSEAVSTQKSASSLSVQLAVLCLAQCRRSCRLRQLCGFEFGEQGVQQNATPRFRRRFTRMHRRFADAASRTRRMAALTGLVGSGANWLCQSSVRALGCYAVTSPVGRHACNTGKLPQVRVSGHSDTP